MLVGCASNAGNTSIALCLFRSAAKATYLQRDPDSSRTEPSRECARSRPDLENLNSLEDSAGSDVQ